MEPEIKKANLVCKICGYELLVQDDKVICQKCNKVVRPNETN